MSRVMHYQVCTYERLATQDDPMRAQYVAKYETGEQRLDGATWIERLTALIELLPGLPETGWHMTVGNPMLCEFYRPAPPPFGIRLILRMPDSEAGASTVT